LFSAIHWYPARFASQIPATLIGLLTVPGELIVDPFAGSGTTLVEAQRLSRRSVGIDLNPIACMLGKAKTLAIPASEIQKLIQRAKVSAREALAQPGPLIGNRSEPMRVPIPSTVQTMWYTTRVREELGILWRLVSRHKEPLSALTRAAFSAILLPVCRETRHWGYVCDNSTPHGNHSGNPLKEFCGILDRFAAAYSDRDADLLATNGPKISVQPSDVKQGDALTELRAIPPDSVDLVLTSPPYFGVSDYVKAQRLSMEWFGCDIEPLRLKEIGARSKRHRVSASREYVEELGSVLHEVNRCLRPKGTCVLILGESATRKSILEQVRTACTNSGLALDLDLNRRVSSQRRQAPSITGEHLLVLTK